MRARRATGSPPQPPSRRAGFAPLPKRRDRAADRRVNAKRCEACAPIRRSAERPSRYCVDYDADMGGPRRAEARRCKPCARYLATERERARQVSRVFVFSRAARIRYRQLRRGPRLSVRNPAAQHGVRIEHDPAPTPAPRSPERGERRRLVQPHSPMSAAILNDVNVGKAVALDIETPARKQGFPYRDTIAPPALPLSVRFEMS